MDVDNIKVVFQATIFVFNIALGLFSIQGIIMTLSCRHSRYQVNPYADERDIEHNGFSSNFLNPLEGEVDEPEW